VACVLAIAGYASRWLAETMNLYHGDCLEILPTFPPASVEAIITDLPYGTTACEWDSIIPLAPMWEQVKRVLKPNGVFVSTASQPFTTALISSNLEWFKYEWIWHKTMPFGFLHAKNAPLKNHENVVVFSDGAIAHLVNSTNRMTYNPQFSKGKPFKKFNNIETKHKWSGMGRPSNHDYTEVNEGTRYPTSIFEFSNANHDNDHPTQKPVNLYEYLIRTYTNPGETVLDFCMGSGTTGVAAVQTGREFIGIEKERKYFEIAEKRVRLAHPPLFVEQPRQPTPLALDNGDSPVLPGFD
jgi:site-specific DNA-methyltransferase (adenine-specific)